MSDFTDFPYFNKEIMKKKYDNPLLWNPGVDQIGFLFFCNPFIYSPCPRFILFIVPSVHMPLNVRPQDEMS